MRRASQQRRQQRGTFIGLHVNSLDLKAGVQIFWVQVGSLSGWCAV
jgi:hypothetical protein